MLTIVKFTSKSKRGFDQLGNLSFGRRIRTYKRKDETGKKDENRRKHQEKREVEDEIRRDGHSGVQCALSCLIFQRGCERRRDWSEQAARNVRIFRRVRRFSCKYVV